MVILLTVCDKVCSNAFHFVSAAERDMNHVGRPNCLIIAKRSFCALCQYGGEPLSCLNILKPSSRCSYVSKVPGSFKSPADGKVGNLHLRRQKDTLCCIC
ncbi:hypothetical protein HOLleu_36106 [Holothuria leucospilota]|uniref:Uncharacterized protein n=1 Tax=Holothuria leucospilota TaxID=206669 RepID=A0A9Q1BDE8_HOLLE|nr:hypothetical protein HOLleu_36106 [Holothuria leucospilota]